MPNACFRCRTSIPSGGTFCRQCRSTVSLSDAASASTPGWWKLAAFGAVATTLSVVLGIAGLSVWETVGAIGTGVVVSLAMLSYFVGLYLDERALQSRSDLDWSPSDWYLTAVLFLSLFVVTIPVLGAYHVYRRRRRVGLE